MKTSTGLWDSLFGNRVEISIPGPNGTERLVSVTRNWIAQMQAQGSISKITEPVVRVHVIGPEGPDRTLDDIDPDEREELLAFDQGKLFKLLMPKIVYKIEYWKVGSDIPEVEVRRLQDVKTGELYALRQNIERGQQETKVVAKNIWAIAKARLGVSD